MVVTVTAVDVVVGLCKSGFSEKKCGLMCWRESGAAIGNTLSTATLFLISYCS